MYAYVCVCVLKGLQDQHKTTYSDFPGEWEWDRIEKNRRIISTEKLLAGLTFLNDHMILLQLF